MIDQRIKARFIDILRCEEADIYPDVSLRFLGADSLDEVEICMGVEKEFNIAISDEEFEKLRTFGDYVNIVNEKLNEETI